MRTYEQLIPLFKDARALPKLPTAAMEILDVLNNENASGQEVERIILRDPALTTGLLRVANSALYGALGNVSTIQSAILRLGIGSVRSLALSMAVTSVTKASSGNFDAEAFARHSVFVGFFARYLFARRKVVEAFRTGWTGDEIFAAGIMHDLPVALLSKLDADTFNTVFDKAKDENCSFCVAFHRIYKQSVGELGALAAQTWNLPKVFSDVLCYIDRPELHGCEEVALSCLALANEAANTLGWAFEKWSITDNNFEQLMDTVGLSESDFKNGFDAVDRHASAFLGAPKAA